MKAPSTLTGDAKKKWDSIQKHFKLDSPLDAESLIQYCEAYSTYKRAKAELDTGELIHRAPNGAPYQNPACAIMIKCSDQMRRLWKQLEACRIADDAEDEELI
jgi:P27 family predicted phage terminase small subunit